MFNWVGNYSQNRHPLSVQSGLLVAIICVNFFVEAHYGLSQLFLWLIEP